VTGLEPGSYTVEIDLAETEYRGEGLRVMNVLCGSVRLAQNLDLFKAAGGFATAYRVRGTVEHAGDPQSGPLTIRLTGRKDRAVFEAIRLKNARGTVVASVTAGELHRLEPVGSERIPDIKEPPIYSDSAQPRERRIDDLIRRMSLREKIGRW